MAYLALPVSAIAAQPDPALNESVSELASLLTDGYATLDQAQLFPVRSSNLVAVFFSLQGPAKGNGSWQFLAFFDVNPAVSPEFPASSNYRLLGYKLVGGKGIRLFNPASATLQHGKVTVGGASFKPNDPMCCPSHSIRSVFTISHGYVIEHRVGS
jgi:hypothetical protein